jgi:hypothetical protein
MPKMGNPGYFEPIEPDFPDKFLLKSGRYPEDPKTRYILLKQPHQAPGNLFCSKRGRTVFFKENFWD